MSVLLPSGETLRQLVRYGMVGLLSNLAGYLVFLLITYLGLEPKLAMTILYAVGASAGFFGNKSWTFGHEGTHLSASVRYLMAHVAGYLLNLAILWVFADIQGHPYQLVQAVSILVVAAFLFFMFRFFVFPASDAKAGGVE